MLKDAEINYLAILAKKDQKSIEDVNDYHFRKPYCDHERSRYLMDLSQVLQLLPAPPKRLLDVGVGSGWTSRMFALSGYNVVGIDIAPDMVQLARALCEGVANVEFRVADFEHALDLGAFDCAVIYEALHHADNPGAALKSIYAALKPGGTLITVEPGRGHAVGSAEIMAKFGTTERDMEFDIQLPLLRQAGFLSIKKYLRLSLLTWLDVRTVGERRSSRPSSAARSTTCETSGFRASSSPPGSDM